MTHETFRLDRELRALSARLERAESKLAQHEDRTAQRLTMLEMGQSMLSTVSGRVDALDEIADELKAAKASARLGLAHPCDRGEVRAVVLRLAELVTEFYSAPGGPDEPNPNEFTARRDALVGRLESIFARKDQ